MRFQPILMLALAFSAPVAASAQGRVNLKSQLANLTQLVAGSKVEILYRRPVARGRTLFGSLVPFGQIWTPSADSAARITLSSAMDVNGSLLEAGSYAIWAIPDAAAWTLIFSRQAEVFHLRYPRDQDVLRVKATPHQGEHVETLQFDFPMVDADSALLQIRWGTTVVPLMLKARSTGS